MKKILSVLAFAIVMNVAAKAQFVDYGVQIGNGASYVADDLFTLSPIWAVNLGGYADYMFTGWKNPWSENIFLRTGLNFVRRGSNFQRELSREPRSIRQWSYHNWYAQIPVIAGFKYEIPQLPAGNFASFYFGPALNVGMFGRIHDRQVTPGMPQSSNNYDTYVTGDKNDRRSFKHLSRFDVSVIIGVGYQWHNYTFDLFLDHGFIALMNSVDALAHFDEYTNEDGELVQPDTKRNSYTGTNQAIVLSIGYQLPINR